MINKAVSSHFVIINNSEIVIGLGFKRPVKFVEPLSDNYRNTFDFHMRMKAVVVYRLRVQDARFVGIFKRRRIRSL